MNKVIKYSMESLQKNSMSNETDIMAAPADAVDADADDDLVIPLRSWMEIEAKKTPLHPMVSINNRTTCSKESIIRKTTVAFGIAELLLRSDDSDNDDGADQDMLQFDNFAVRVSKQSPLEPDQPCVHQPWDDIKGVSMKCPRLALSIEEPAYLSCLMEPEEKQDQLGRYLEVEEMLTEAEEMQTEVKEMQTSTGSDEEGLPLRTKDEERKSDHRCYYMVAKLLYELFAHESFPEASSLLIKGVTTASTEEPAPKRAKSSQEGSLDKAEQPFQTPSKIRMQQLGIPALLCLMTENLLGAALRGDDGQSSNDAYKSLRDVAKDLHLLLLDPNRFLFNTEHMKLQYREEKLYGRDKEEKLITDAFCRVSRGTSEAFFISGFSGCGKSMLVNTLRARVNAVGGYVIKHKFDDLSQERSLSGVISALDQLCLMLKDRNTPPEIALLAKKLNHEFGADIALLARIVKNVRVLLPEFVSPAWEEEEASAGGGDTMNVRSVGFTLSRFMRLVSSPKHPVMVSHLRSAQFYLSFHSEEENLMYMFFLMWFSSFWTTYSGLMTQHLK